MASPLRLLGGGGQKFGGPKLCSEGFERGSDWAELTCRPAPPAVGQPGFEPPTYHACFDRSCSPHCLKPSLPLKKPELCVSVCLPACPTDCLTGCLSDQLTDWLTVSLSSRCTAKGNIIF